MKNETIIELRELAADSEKLVIHPYNQENMGIHGHHFFELVYITGGTAVHTLGGISTRLQKGDYFIVDYGSQHSYSESNNLTIINCLFLPEIIEDTLKGISSFEVLMQQCLIRYYKFTPQLTLSNSIFHDEDEKILLLLTGMLSEYQEKLIGCTEIFRLRLIEILILTMRRIIGNHVISQNSFVMQVISYINSNFKNRKILSSFCKEYHFSLQYVSRKFKQETGMTIMKYLQKVRIEKSCELLTGSSMNIAEIANEIGYEDVKFFNQMFFRLLKMTPREYRKMSSSLQAEP